MSRLEMTRSYATMAVSSAWQHLSILFALEQEALFPFSVLNAYPSTEHRSDVDGHGMWEQIHSVISK